MGVLREALRILDAAEAPHIVIGGVATRAVLGMPLSVAEDIDLLIRAEDAERLLGAFERAGYATHRHDERWIYKAARPDVTADLIFRAGERIELDEQHLARSRTTILEEIPLRVPAAEDLVVMKAVFDAEDRQGKWYGALTILRRSEIDWDYLVERGSLHAPTRLLSLLLYALDAGIVVPPPTLEHLASVALGPSRAPSRPSWLA
jgi:Uncharacterised nucleotidyltransferase